MRFESSTYLEVFLDGFSNVLGLLECRSNMNDKWTRIEFWERLSLGWMDTYIYPYDDPFNSKISKQRKMRIGQ